MAANFSEYMSKKILDSLFVDGVALPIYGSLWIALFHNSTGTTEANLRDNTPINEITDSAYARVELVITAGASFNAGIPDVSGIKIDNINEIAWPAAAANYPNQITHIALFDALTSGNIIVYSDFSAITINAGENAEIIANAFTVNL